MHSRRQAAYAGPSCPAGETAAATDRGHWFSGTRAGHGAAEVATTARARQRSMVHTGHRQMRTSGSPSTFRPVTPVERDPSWSQKVSTCEPPGVGASRRPAEYERRRATLAARAAARRSSLIGADDRRQCLPAPGRSARTTCSFVTGCCTAVRAAPGGGSCRRGTSGSRRSPAPSWGLCSRPGTRGRSTAARLRWRWRRGAA